MLNGGVYEGQWSQGKANGYGKYTFPDQSTFTAIWIDNLANGQGTFTHPDGDNF